MAGLLTTHRRRVAPATFRHPSAAPNARDWPRGRLVRGSGAAAAFSGSQNSDGFDIVKDLRTLARFSFLISAIVRVARDPLGIGKR